MLVNLVLWSVSSTAIKIRGSHSLLQPLVDISQYLHSYITIGPEFVNHHFKTSHGQVKVSLWDTVGQEKYRAINKVFYREAKGALLIYDLSDTPDRESLEYWIKEFQDYADKHAQIALIGSKADLDSNPDTEKMMEDFAAKYNIVFTKVSSKKGMNVEKAVQDLVDLISEKYFCETSESFQSDFRRIDKQFGSSYLTASKITENKRCCTS